MSSFSTLGDKKNVGKFYICACQKMYSFILSGFSWLLIAFSWGALFSPRICFWRFFSFFGSLPLFWKYILVNKEDSLKNKDQASRKALWRESETPPPEHGPRATEADSLSTLSTSPALMLLISRFPCKGKCGGEGCQANQTGGKNNTFKLRAKSPAYATDSPSVIVWQQTQLLKQDAEDRLKRRCWSEMVCDFFFLIHSCTGREISLWFSFLQQS